jgi:hypothetical protein
MNNRIRSIVFNVFTLVITLIFILTVGINAFAVESTNKHDIEFDYPNMIYLDSVNHFYPNMIYLDSVNHFFKDKNMIIPITTLENSNEFKIDNCAISYRNMIPKIYRDDERHWLGAKVACAYGLYNYNLNIGDRNLDPILRIQIEGESEICMLDDHCMKKIDQIIEGKIALQSKPSTPITPPKQNSIIPPQKTPQQEEQELVSFCVHYLYAVDQPQSCENLSADVKQKVQIEAEKRQ